MTRNYFLELIIDLTSLGMVCCDTDAGLEIINHKCLLSIGSLPQYSMNVHTMYHTIHCSYLINWICLVPKVPRELNLKWHKILKRTQSITLVDHLLLAFSTKEPLEDIYTSLLVEEYIRISLQLYLRFFFNSSCEWDTSLMTLPFFSSSLIISVKNNFQYSLKSSQCSCNFNKETQNNASSFKPTKKL